MAMGRWGEAARGEGRGENGDGVKGEGRGGDGEMGEWANGASFFPDFGLPSPVFRLVFN